MRGAWIEIYMQESINEILKEVAPHAGSVD